MSNFRMALICGNWFASGLTLATAAFSGGGWMYGVFAGVTGVAMAYTLRAEDA